MSALPEVNTVKARVWTRDNAIASNLDLGLVPRANVANVTQEASRLVVDIIQTELGLPVAGLPDVRVSFGGEKPQPVAAAAGSEATAASSMYRPPQEQAQSSPLDALRRTDDAPPYSRPADNPPPFSRPASSDAPPPFSRPAPPADAPSSPPPDDAPSPPSSADAPSSSPPPADAGEGTPDESPGRLTYDADPPRRDDEPGGGSPS